MKPKSEELSQYGALRTQPRIPLVQAVPLAAPFAIYLETTNICNFKCKFCPESFSDYAETAGGLFRMGMDDYLEVLSQIADLTQPGRLKTLNFYMMGEPFANKLLTQFISIAHDKAIAERLTVTTNASLLKSNIWESVIRSGLDYLRVSIYGGSSEAHRANTASGISLDRIVENVGGFKAFRDAQGATTPHIYVKMIESPYAGENQEFFDRFSSVADEIKLEPVMNWNDPAQGNLSGLSAEELMNSDYLKNHKSVCPFPFYSLVIHSDLQVSVCCVDWNKKVVMGSLREQSLRDIWTGPAMHEFRMRHLRRERSQIPGCASCTFLHTAPDNMDPLSAQEYESRVSALATRRPTPSGFTQ
jgi:radical SAM protein with 4Fe4S-binding SPASM domain